MKILLVCKSKSIEVLGLMYLSAIAKQNKHQCKIVDINQAFAEFINFGATIIGFSIMTGDMDKFRSLANAIRDVSGKFSSREHRIIVGGPDPTFFPEGYKWADDIVRGDAEEIFATMIGSRKKYDDINKIPHPDRTDFPNMKIRDFISSRGCGSSCGYCYNSSWYKLFPDVERIRVRYVKDVIKELKEVKPQFAYFQDSCFGVKMSWMREFSDQYSRYVKAPYHVHLRPKQANDERVALLHKSNCVSVKIALETASDRLRKLINRGNTNNEDAIKASRLLRKWGIALIMQNILGLPTATIEEDLHTLEVNIQCRPAYAWCSIFQPYPKTELALICEKNGWYKGDYSEIGDNFFDRSLLNFSDEHKEQIEVLQRIFAFCVEMKYLPKKEELTYQNLPKLIHKIMRTVGDKRMFPGIL